MAATLFFSIIILAVLWFKARALLIGGVVVFILAWVAAHSNNAKQFLAVVVFVGVAALACWLFTPSRSTAHALGRRQCCRDLRASGVSDEEVETHEGGHYESGVDRGSTGVRAELTPNHPQHLGVMYSTQDRSALDAAVITAIGTEATNVLMGRFWYQGTTPGDDQLLVKQCKAAGITPGQARALARHDARRLAPKIRKTAKHLRTHGRIG